MLFSQTKQNATKNIFAYALRTVPEFSKGRENTRENTYIIKTKDGRKRNFIVRGPN